MRLLLIRHAQSVTNAGGEDIESEDSYLSELGERQAMKLARAFTDGRLPEPDHLCTSLMARAVQTIAPTADALGMDVNAILDSYEVGGVARFTESDPMAGLGRADLVRLCPRLILPPEVSEDGWYPDVVEDRVQAWPRARAVAESLLNRYGSTNDVVAMVSHGMFMQLIMRALMRWTPDMTAPYLDVWFMINNTGTVYMRTPGLWERERANVWWINRTDHLERVELTD